MPRQARRWTGAGGVTWTSHHVIWVKRVSAVGHVIMARLAAVLVQQQAMQLTSERQQIIIIITSSGPGWVGDAGVSRAAPQQQHAQACTLHATAQAHRSDLPAPAVMHRTRVASLLWAAANESQGPGHA
mmetsp:Transcript_18628/g.56255  ORF Transcript_18628/g.56255 Transcript_18628/m.56255 type:complete len:129 (+) Transcript_18628:712-1098(+)